jgi:hypothetical protein
MSYIILILYIGAALFFAVDAVRTGQPLFWLFILFIFPLLGSLVYFFAVYYPNSTLKSKVRKTFKSLNPTNELKKATDDFDFTPSVQNQMNLALALFETGAFEDAAINYEACLKGAFANDTEILFCAARSFLGCGRYAKAIEHLENIRGHDAKFRPEQVGLLMARALAKDGRKEEAVAEFETATSQFGSFESYVEYAIWAYESADSARAARLEDRIEQITKKWNRYNHELNADIIKRLNAARSLG